MAEPSTPGVTDVPRALPASAWLTTEHELKLAVPAEVVGGEPAGVVVAAPVDPVEIDKVPGEELQAASAMAATVTPIPTTAGRHFTESLIATSVSWSTRLPRRSVMQRRRTWLGLGGNASRLRTLGDCLDSFEGAEHVPLVATLPQDSTERAPNLGEEVVAKVE